MTVLAAVMMTHAMLTIASRTVGRVVKIMMTMVVVVVVVVVVVMVVVVVIMTDATILAMVKMLFCS